MARYIDAERLCRGLRDMASVQYPDKQNTILGVVSTIENTPTADVVEVRHGEWKINPDGYYPYCSSCGTEPENGVMSNYCPNCGVKMKK